MSQQSFPLQRDHPLADVLESSSRETPSFLNLELSTPTTTGTSNERSDIVPGVSTPPELITVHIGGQHYVIYDKEKNDLFYSWWDKTNARQQIANKSFHHPQWNNRHRTSTAWNQFHQAAESPTGTPKIICKICDTVLVHPSYTSHGTQGMNKHRESMQCKQATKGKQSAGYNIISAMVSAVT
jgi:hypothetical protein